MPGTTGNLLLIATEIMHLMHTESLYSPSISTLSSAEGATNMTASSTVSDFFYTSKHNRLTSCSLQVMAHFVCLKAFLK